MSDDFKFVDMTNMLIDTALDGIADQENKEQAERMLAARKVWLRALQKIAAGEFEYERVLGNKAAVMVNIRKRGLTSVVGIRNELREIARGHGYDVWAPYGWSSSSEYVLHLSFRARV